MRRFQGSQQVSLSRVVNPGPLLLGPEVVCLTVGLVVVEVVRKVSEPESDCSISVCVAFVWICVENTHSLHDPRASDRTSHARPWERQRCISRPSRSRSRRSSAHGMRIAPDRTVSTCSVLRRSGHACPLAQPGWVFLGVKLRRVQGKYTDALLTLENVQ